MKDVAFATQCEQLEACVIEANTLLTKAGDDVGSSSSRIRFRTVPSWSFSRDRKGGQKRTDTIYFAISFRAKTNIVQVLKPNTLSTITKT